MSGHRDRDRARDRNRDRDRDRDRPRDKNWEKERQFAKERDAERDREREIEKKKYLGLTGNQIERLRAKERAANTTGGVSTSGVSIPNAPLSEDDFENFTSQLQYLTVAREKIRDAMGFAYDKIESATEVTEA